MKTVYCVLFSSFDGCNSFETSIYYHNDETQAQVVCDELEKRHKNDPGDHFYVEEIQISDVICNDSKIANIVDGLLRDYPFWYKGDL